MRPVEAVFFLYSKHILSRQQPLPSNRRQHELLWLSWCEGRLSELFTAVLFTTIEHSHKHTRLWAVLSLQMYYGARWFRFIRFSLGFCEFFLARAILFILCFWCFWCIFSCLFWAVSTSASDCLERLVSEMTMYVSSWARHKTLLTHWLQTADHFMYNVSILAYTCMYSGWRSRQVTAI